MRIFTRKRFEFRNGDDVVLTQPLAFQDVPDWVQKTTLYQWALKDGDIEVPGSTADVAKIEKTADKK